MQAIFQIFKILLSKIFKIKIILKMIFIKTKFLNIK